MNLTELQSLTKRFADARGQLTAVVTELNNSIEAAKRKKLAAIRELVSRAAGHESELRSAIEANPQLFITPRTVVFHGIKVGMQKGKGGIEFDDPDSVLERIRKEYGSDAIGLIHVVETPDKKMLADLAADELKKLGCTLVGTDDEVVIRPTDTEVDKIVNRLLKSAADEA